MLFQSGPFMVEGPGRVSTEKTMRLITVLTACIVILAITPFVVFGQTTKSPDYRSTLCDSTAATTAWDSVWTGGNHLKTVSIIHNGTAGVLLVATENDTTAGKILFVRAITGYGDTYSFLTRARWIRTKVSTGTINRDVAVSDPPPAK